MPPKQTNNPSAAGETRREPSPIGQTWRDRFRPLTGDAAWPQYSAWFREVWQGRVAGVLDELRTALAHLGPPPPTADPVVTEPAAGREPGKPSAPLSPRDLLLKTITYLENNQSRMDYPRYRQQGLPITSSLVESLVKEFNHRVKGTEKYWNEDDGTEPILQLMAASLSEDDRLHKHLINRPGEIRRPYRRSLDLVT